MHRTFPRVRRGLSRPSSLIIAGACMALALAAGPGAAHQPALRKAPIVVDAEAANEQVASAQTLTLSLIEASGRVSAASTLKARDAGQATLQSVARQRFDTLKRLVVEDPAEALRVSLPSDLRANLPAGLAPFLEQDAEELGELEVYHVDHTDPALDRYEFFVNSANGRFQIHFAGQSTSHLTGENVRAKGLRIGDALLVDSGDSVTTVGLKAAAVPNSYGQQKTLLILVNFTDDLAQPFTVASAQATMFTGARSVSNFDYEASYQQTWLTGDVAGWFTISELTTACNSSAIATKAKAAAQSAGFVLSNYTRFVYAFPGSSCTWWGLGSVGGNPSNSWIAAKYGFVASVIGHEMGHNFGLYHSHSLDCGTVSYATTGCTLSEYGDVFDTMGSSSSSRVPHYNAFQKERLGWLNGGASPPLTTITGGNAQYTIGAMANVRDTVPRALKISMSTSCAAAQQWYYVESRQAKGFDDWLSSYPGITGGVLVHNVVGSSADGSNLLDMTPATTSWNDASLPLGTTFTDPVSGLTITPVSVGTNASTIAIGYPPATCTQAAPSIAITPTGTQYSSAGATTTYTVNVTNKDSCNCAAATFNIAAAVPAGWSATSAQAAGVAAGASASRTISVTSASGTSPAFYTIPLSATNAAAPSFGASANGTIAIIGALAATVTTDKATYVRPSKGNQTINAVITTNVTSGGSPQSGAAVSVQVRDPAGAVVATLGSTTNSAGAATVSFGMKRNSATGAYTATSTATVGTSSTTATKGFMLQ